MTSRDRMVIVGVLALLILGVGWVKFVSPERKKVSAANAQISSARQKLQSAQQELSQAQSGQKRFAEAYAAIVSIGKAVPTTAQTPALLYELDAATGEHHVEFSTFSPSATSSSSSAAAAAAAAATSGGFKSVPFTFTFTGSFTRLYDLLNTLQGFAVQMPTGNIEVTGRLMTIQALSLTPAQATSDGPTAGSKAGSEELTGTITASAYVLPATAALPSGATAQPTPAGSATPASSSSSTSAATPATIKAVG